MDALFGIGVDEDVWRFMPPPVRTRDDMAAWVEAALQEAALAHACPFVVLAGSERLVAGSSRFGAMALAHGRVEIGWTWIGKAWRRTAVNTEMKLLMLTHAFEVFGCQRVELKTDTRNARSRAAMLRIGAREECTMRKHMRLPDGSYRDTVYYRITDDEWPRVRAILRKKLGRDPRSE